MAALPPWASELVEQYESGAASQFIVFGNVQDRLLERADAGSRLADLRSFLLDVLLPRFDVVLSYDLGSGIRVEKGGPVFSAWPNLKEAQTFPKAPRPAIELLTHYFRYSANLARLNQKSQQVACLLFGADLIAPAVPAVADYELGAMVTLLRDWANEDLLCGHALATFLICENLHDLHPLLANNARTARVRMPLPSPGEISGALELLARNYPGVIAAPADCDALGRQLAGVTVGALDGVVRTKHHLRQPLNQDDVVQLRKAIVERDSNGLIDFIESTRTLDDLAGLENVKAWLRQDIALWRAGDTGALPKGYLICGPVGTGKTFLVECLAGEAGVPVVRLKNFRDKWVGSTEGNLEKIFRLIQALGRCYVFIDEADQALGRRDAGSNDSGISGRVYSMIAEEMGSSLSRGRVIWILATSRPDLVEVDLKRPGRVDVKIPLFPAATAREGFDLIHAMFRARGLPLAEDCLPAFEPLIPALLTPGAAEALTVRAYRLVRTAAIAPSDALRTCLDGYRNPVPRDIMEAQIRLAAREASDIAFVPRCFQEQN